MRLRFALADDHPLFRMGLRLALEARGHIVTEEFSRGDDLIASCARLTEVDVLVIDVRMPGADGIRAVEHVRKASPSLAIAMVTSYDDAATRARAADAGITTVMAKDASPADLVSALETAMPLTSVEQGAHAPFNLTIRELEVLDAIVAGQSNREIAAALGISVETVKDHVRQIYSKLGVGERASAVRVALRHGVVS